MSFVMPSPELLRVRRQDCQTFGRCNRVYPKLRQASLFVQPYMTTSVIPRSLAACEVRRRQQSECRGVDELHKIKRDECAATQARNPGPLGRSGNRVGGVCHCGLHAETA